MAKRTNGFSENEHGPTASDIINAVERKAYLDARAPLNSEESILLFLRSWWSRTYNRPLKDPILLSYSFEELLYEFYDKIERKKAAEEAVEQETDKIEEKKDEDFEKWAAAEEARELEEARLEEERLAALSDPKSTDNQDWMKAQILAQKELYGDDFGEDIEFYGE